MQYVANTGASAVALAAATAKTVISVYSSSTASGQLIEFGLFFDGVTGSNTPVLVELLKQKSASSTGTKTETTPVQTRGDSNTTETGLASLFKSFANFTAEPTELTLIKPYLVPPTAGLLVQAPLGREVSLIPSMGLVIRVTAAQVVNCRGYMEFIQGST